MDIKNFEEVFNNATSLTQISQAEWKINCEASFIDGKPLDIRLINLNNRWFFTDRKQTLRYMNDLYELNAKDVKSCITNVLKIYGFSIIFVDIYDKSEDHEGNSDKTFYKY